MKVVLDADLLSTFARIERLDILDLLFEQVLVPQSAIAELSKAEIDTRSLKFEIAVFSREELLSFKRMDARLGKGERECLAISKHRKLMLASNDRLVQETCRSEGVGCFTLPLLLRFAISKNVIRKETARKLVNLIEREERTLIKNKEEIFK